MTSFANYQYSLTAYQQEAIQLFLRVLPLEYHGTVWTLLHELTYTNDWTKDKPKYSTVPGNVTVLFPSRGDVQ